MAESAGMTERQIQRALYWHHRSAAIMLPNYRPPWWYECDLFVVTRAGFCVEYEIKVTRPDFRRDSRKTRKHERLAMVGGGCTCRPTRFFYVVPEKLILPGDVPSYAGLVYLSKIGNSHHLRVAIIRQARRLCKERLGDETSREMRRLSYHRLWAERFRFDDYRETVRRMAESNRVLRSDDNECIHQTG